MSDFLLQSVGFISALVIYGRSESVLNAMTIRCRLLVRIAFWLLAVGASGLAILVLMCSYIPPVSGVLLAVGVAALLTSERRIRALLNIHDQSQSDRRIPS